MKSALTDTRNALCQPGFHDGRPEGKPLSFIERGFQNLELIFRVGGNESERPAQTLSLENRILRKAFIEGIKVFCFLVLDFIRSFYLVDCFQDPLVVFALE